MSRKKRVGCTHPNPKRKPTRWVWVVEDLNAADLAGSGLRGVYSAGWKANRVALDLIAKVAKKAYTSGDLGPGMRFMADAVDYEVSYRRVPVR